MKKLGAILLASAVLPAAEVHVYTAHNTVAPAVLQYAQAQAAWMFRQIGTPIRWHGIGTAERSPDGLAIRIEFSERTPPQSHPGALAYAQPFDRGTPAITILYDRIRLMVERQPGVEGRLLAHVLAHEICHILEGTDRHSTSGVMKARWTSDDLAQMRKAPLPFTPVDREMIAERIATAR